MQTLADFWPLAGFLVERREIDPAAWDKVMKDGPLERLRGRARRSPGRRAVDQERVEAALRGVVDGSG